MTQDTEAERPVEPSDTERGNWPQATQDYVEYLESVEVERDRLRDLITGIRKHADEWAISQMTGNPHLENEKSEALWQAIRRAPGMTAPIYGSAALTGEAKP